MEVFAQDLIDQNRSSSSSSIAGSSSSSMVDVTVNTTSQTFLQFDIDIIDRIVTSVNIFALAWSIFYSYYFLVQFFQYRIIGAKGKVSDELDGMEGMYLLLGIWWRYMACLVVLVIYGLSRSSDLGLFIGVVSVLAFVIKIYVDFMKILNLFSYFPWSKKLAKNLKKRFKWKD